MRNIPKKTEDNNADDDRKKMEILDICREAFGKELEKTRKEISFDWGLTMEQLYSKDKDARRAILAVDDEVRMTFMKFIHHSQELLKVRSLKTFKAKIEESRDEYLAEYKIALGKWKRHILKAAHLLEGK